MPPAFMLRVSLKRLSVVTVCLILLYAVATFVFNWRSERQLKEELRATEKLMKREHKRDAVAFYCEVGRAKEEHLISYGTGISTLTPIRSELITPILLTV